MGAIVGLVGAGRMGLPICARLTAAGFSVLVADSDPAREAVVRAAGASWQEAGPALREGATWIDMTTVSPAVARRLREPLVARGVLCLEAMLAGGPEAAARGALQLYVGAAPEAVERHSELLEALGTVVHVGDAGAGYTTKLLVNLLWFGQALATSEALLLARRDGIDLGVGRAPPPGGAAPPPASSRPILTTCSTATT
jgi:3-hydroxyisobutyrate dehydrogenase-like beta-hydroxyacid dehydrogenase